jgi:YggT family protein
MEILIRAIEIYRYVVFAAVIASWVAPGSDHPIVRFLEKLTEPVFAPIRKILPAMGGFDLSPLVVLLGLSLLTRLL